MSPARSDAVAEVGGQGQAVAITEIASAVLERAARAT